MKERSKGHCFSCGETRDMQALLQFVYLIQQSNQKDEMNFCSNYLDKLTCVDRPSSVEHRHSIHFAAASAPASALQSPIV